MNVTIKYKYRELARLELQLFEMKKSGVSIANSVRIRIEDQIEKIRCKIDCLEDEKNKGLHRGIKQKAQYYHW